MTDSDELVVQKWVTFASMYAGYTMTVVNRKSFSFAMPAIMSNLHLDKDQLGLISSSQNLAYTISKFFGGILSDNVNSKFLFSSGLFLSALVTIAMTAFQSTTPFAILWFIQGLVQGGTWPACAKILKQWFPAASFGTWYSVLNTTMNLACSVGPLLTALVVATFSWQFCLTAYGLVSLVISVLCFFTISNSPAEACLCSSTEEKDDEKSNKKQTGARSGKGRGTWRDMLRSPFMWLLSLTYLIVFMGRTATLDWAQLYLIQELGHSQYIGSLYVSSLEVGGIIGSVLAGYVADKLVTSSRQETIEGSQRLNVATGFLLLYILGLHFLFFFVTASTSQVWIIMIGFLTGCGIYGLVSLYGVMAIEAAPTHLSGTSHAIVSSASNFGAILAGLPFSYIATQLEWHGSFVLLEGLLAATFIVNIAARNVEYKMVPTKKKLQ